MKASELAQTLEVCIDLQHPAIVTSPPGVGKSQILRQVADKLNRKFIDVRAAYFDAIDVRGFPMPDVKNGVVKFLKPRFIREAETAAQEGFDGSVIAFDEMLKAPPATQNALNQALLDRQIDEHKIPDDCAMIAAANLASHRAGSYRVNTDIANRLLWFELDVDLNDWCRYALAQGAPSELVAFIRYRPHLLHQFDPDADEPAFPSPRMWLERVAEMMTYPKSLNSAELEMYQSAVGKMAATELYGFLKVWRQLPSPDAALIDPDGTPVPADPAVRYAMAGALAKRADDLNFDRVIRYAARMSRDFATLTVRDAIGRDRSLQNTRAFIEWNSQHKITA